MPWTTPTLKETRRLTRDYVLSQLGAKVMIPNSVLRIMSDAMSGLTHLTLLYIDWLSKQFLPDTAEQEWLDRHGVIWLVNADGSLGRKAATYAKGALRFEGSVAGTLIPIGSVLTGNNGVEYQTVTAGAISSDLAGSANAVALTSGVIGNLPDGEALFLSPAIDGVTSAFAVGDMTGGVDMETDEQLRERVLFRIRQPPMGGDANDYVAWAMAVPGVTRAWCSPLEMGMGTVTVRFMMDDVRAGNGGFPLQEDCDMVAEYLDTQRPVAVKDFFVEAPIPEPIDFTITKLLDDSESARAGIEASVTDMLRIRAAPAHAVDGVAQAAQTIYAAWVSEAILDAPGVDEFALVMTDHYMPSPGHMAVLGSIHYG